MDQVRKVSRRGESNVRDVHVQLSIHGAYVAKQAPEAVRCFSIVGPIAYHLTAMSATLVGGAHGGVAEQVVPWTLEVEVALIQDRLKSAKK